METPTLQRSHGNPQKYFYLLNWKEIKCMTLSDKVLRETETGSVSKIADAESSIETFTIIFGQWRNGHTLIHSHPFLALFSITSLLSHVFSLTAPHFSVLSDLLLGTFILSHKHSSNIYWLPTVVSVLSKL